MMNRLLLSIILGCLISVATFAQITIQSTDFPEVGNLVVSAIDRQTVINPGVPGTNQTWDFSNLVATEWDSAYYVLPSTIPASQNYPGTTMVVNHNPRPAGGNYHYNFILETTGGWKSVGDQNYTILFPGFTMAMYFHYDPASYYLPVPFTYGSSHNQSFKMVWYITTTMSGTVLDSMKAVSHINMSMLGDASGTMINPYGSYPVIRVKENLTSQDSTFHYTNGQWVYESDTTSSWAQYRWYTNNHGEIGYYSEGSKKANDFTFFKSETVVGIQDQNRDSKLDIYPNPAQNNVHIEHAGLNDIQIYDMSGNRMNITVNDHTIDVSAFPQGTYIVKVKTIGGYATSRFVKQ